MAVLQNLKDEEEKIDQEIFMQNITRGTYTNMRNRIQKEVAQDTQEIKEMKLIFEMHEKQISSMQHREEVREKAGAECKVVERKEQRDMQDEKRLNKVKHLGMMELLKKRTEQEENLLAHIEKAVKYRKELENAQLQQEEDTKKLSKQCEEHRHALDQASALLQQYRKYNDEIQMLNLIKQQGGSFSQKLKENEKLENTAWKVVDIMNEKQEELASLIAKRDV